MPRLTEIAKLEGPLQDDAAHGAGQDRRQESRSARSRRLQQIGAEGSAAGDRGRRSA